MNSVKQIVFDVRLTALAIESLFVGSAGTFIKPPPVGAYTKDRVQPFWYPGCKDHYQYIGKNLFPVNVIDTTKPVFNADGKLTLTVKGIRSLSQTSHSPLRGIEMIERIIRAYVRDNEIWREFSSKVISGKLVDRPDDLTFDDELATIVESYIDYTKITPTISQISELINYVIRLLNNIFYMLENFLGSDNWEITTVELTNTTLYVTKHGDWRIQDWMCRYVEDRLP
jgi:hypothetical protein